MTKLSNTARWQVTGQVPRIKAGAANNIEEGYDISFITGEGHAGTVFVAMPRYTPDRVRAILSEQAALLDSVGALTSDG